MKRFNQLDMGDTFQTPSNAQVYAKCGNKEGVIILSSINQKWSSKFQYFDANDPVIPVSVELLNPSGYVLEGSGV